MNAKPTGIRDNLTSRELQALKKLQRRTDIIIKPADKGSGTVVMNRLDYINCLVSGHPLELKKVSSVVRLQELFS